MSRITSENDSQIIIYQTESGQTKIEVRLENETVWLTQKLMAELFQTSKQNVGQHLKNIFADGELKEGSVVKKFFTTAADSKNYSTAFYNLDAIISVGYRVQSHVATRFRQWATRHIREYNQMRIRQADKIEGAFERAIQGIPVHKIEKEEHDES